MIKQDAWTAYNDAYKKAQKTRDRGLQYIVIQQRAKPPGYTLVATNNGGRPEAVVRQASIMTWAENIVYRLAYLGYLDKDRDGIDAMFAECDRVGYGSTDKKGDDHGVR